MAGKVTSMSVRLTAAVAAVVEGREVNISAVCRAEEISRKTFYKWVHRYRVEGLAGLGDRSRRPHHSPGQVPGEVEDEIVRRRKELRDGGLDHGATTIWWHLGHDPAWQDRVPSPATIHRVLVRRGVVVPEPRKRPRRSWRRFEAPAPNEWWQVDATDWMIATGLVQIISFLDDHSRLLAGSRAVTVATTDAAWTTFGEAAAWWGLPAGMLSDNGLVFSGKLHGVEVAFEARLRDVGVRPFTGRPYHPQTTGKIERFHQTLKRWLRRQPVAADLAELQAQLDTFARIYNYQRPHQALGRATPITRWQATTPAQPATEPLEHPTYPPRVQRAETTVTANGIVNAGGFVIHIGIPWQGHHAVITLDHHHANVFIAGHLVRHLELHPDRHYYGSGRKRGGPRQPRLPS
jgi:transposase InsO family protein